MAWLSDNDMYEAFGSRALFHAAYGGSDFGECQQTVARVGDGDIDAWQREWTATADGLVAAADASVAAGHRVGAREAYLRATTYYRTGYFPLFAAPVDPRLRDAFDREEAAFAKAVPLFDAPTELVDIPFEGGSLPGVFIRVDGTAARRPTVVYTNGYDSNVHEMYVAHAAAAIDRGYNILLFDGPGQGRSVIRDGLRMRPDWETVVTPVIDWTLARAEVDPDRIVLAGWSFGGFLAPRAAAFEHRIAALVADPGQWDQRDTVVPHLPLSDEDKARFPDVDPAALAPMQASLDRPDADPFMRWKMVGRASLVNGTTSLFDYLAEMMRYEISSVASQIACPTLLTMAEGDPTGAGAQTLLDAVSADRKTLLRFTVAEGAGGHCEGMSRRLYHQRVYDWLDETLASG